MEIAEIGDCVYPVLQPGNRLPEALSKMLDTLLSQLFKITFCMDKGYLPYVYSIKNNAKIAVSHVKPGLVVFLRI